MAEAWSWKSGVNHKYNKAERTILETLERGCPA